jgi:hypothetical protein
MSLVPQNAPDNSLWVSHSVFVQMSHASLLLPSDFNARHSEARVHFPCLSAVSSPDYCNSEELLSQMMLRYCDVLSWRAPTSIWYVLGYIHALHTPLPRKHVRTYDSRTCRPFTSRSVSAMVEPWTHFPGMLATEREIDCLNSRFIELTAVSKAETCFYFTLMATVGTAVNLAFWCSKEERDSLLRCW